MDERFNIPTRLMFDGRTDKASVELICFGIAIKAAYGSSSIKDVSISCVRRLLSCGQKKAKSLIEAAKGSSLFRYDEKSRTLTALNWKKDKIETVRTRKGALCRIVLLTTAYRTEINGKSLRELVKWFRRKLAENLINVRVRKSMERTKAMAGARTRKIRATESQAMISLNAFGKAIGTSRYTAARTVNQLDRKYVRREKVYTWVEGASHYEGNLCDYNFWANWSDRAFRRYPKIYGIPEGKQSTSYHFADRFDKKKGSERRSHSNPSPSLSSSPSSDSSFFLPLSHSATFNS